MQVMELHPSHVHTHTHTQYSFGDTSLGFNLSDPGVLVVNGLEPYTVYTAQVEACTQFGCTLSPLVAERTLESGMFE